MQHVCKSFSVPQKGQRGWKSLFYRRNRHIEVLSNISFNVNQGEFVGYIGPNGAGKSTTIKLLTGILYPSQGSISVLGFEPHRDRYKYTYRIGAVFGQRSLLEYDIPVMDSFVLYKSIYELEKQKFKKRLHLFSELLDLKELLHIPVRKLSLGQRMRCEIAASLLHEPQVVFLDEPTIGLDALAKQEIRLFLKKINKNEKVTIILTTHDMDDIEELCERIIFINEGSIIFDGPQERLKSRYATHKEVEIVYEKSVTVPPEFEHLVKKIDAHTYTFKVTYFDAVEIIPSLLRLGPAKDVSIHEQRLEDIVKIIYRDAAGSANGK